MPKKKPKRYRYPDRTTIWLHRDTLKLLTQQSRMGDSYDDVIRRLLSGEGEVWVEVLAVDNDSPAKHKVLFKLGNFYYEWNGKDFVPVEPRKVKTVVGA